MSPCYRLSPAARHRPKQRHTNGQRWGVGLGGPLQPGAIGGQFDPLARGLGIGKVILHQRVPLFKGFDTGLTGGVGLHGGLRCKQGAAVPLLHPFQAQWPCAPPLPCASAGNRPERGGVTREVPFEHGYLGVGSSSPPPPRPPMPCPLPHHHWELISQKKIGHEIVGAWTMRCFT